MIAPINMLIPSGHYEIMSRLRQMGIEPTGNREFDRNLLVRAVKEKTAKIEEKKEAEEKRIEKQEEQRDREALEIERKGADAIGWYNRVFLGI